MLLSLVLLEFPELAYSMYAHRKWDSKASKSLAVMPGGWIYVYQWMYMKQFE